MDAGNRPFFFKIFDRFGSLGSYWMMNLVLFTSSLTLTTFFRASDLSNVCALAIAASTTLLLYPLYHLLLRMHSFFLLSTLAPLMKDFTVEERAGEKSIINRAWFTRTCLAITVSALLTVYINIIRIDR